MPLRLLKFAFSDKYPEQRMFRAPDRLKPEYDVVIIGGGGHGLAAAYYLAKDHGITNVAVLEKGYVGGGGTGRNTAIVRVVSLFQDSFKDDVFYDNVRDGAFDIFYAGIFTKLLFRRCKNLHRMFTILREESVRSSSYCIAWSFLIDDDRLDSAATGN